jgi:hypothetical protein
MLEQYQRDEIAELVNEFNGDNPSGYYGDRLGELVDSYLPIYYTDIVDEWKAMPSQYDNMGVAMFGVPSEIDIFQLMTLDLLNYYGELVNEYANEYGKSIGVDVYDYA